MITSSSSRGRTLLLNFLTFNLLEGLKWALYTKYSLIAVITALSESLVTASTPLLKFVTKWRHMTTRMPYEGIHYG